MPGSRSVRRPSWVERKLRAPHDLLHSARRVDEMPSFMSGIAGELRLDGDHSAKRDLERMASALHRYGPDRSEIVMSGPVGLALTLMRMTPEVQFCHQPWRGGSGATFVADLLLDNRDD